MPRGLRRADYWLFPWQIRAIQRLAASTHNTPSAVVRDLITASLPPPLRPGPASPVKGLADGAEPPGLLPDAPR